MTTSSGRISEIFRAALEFESPTERSQYLDQACGEEPDLRERVEDLLLAHENAGSFLHEEDVEATVAYTEISECVGVRIGPYKLVEQIGEGGMGVVFRAEQTEPIRREVALKVIKPGMDTKQVIARFEVERQALAMMDHPHIARVLDAGTTETGRPYFVMELVKGLPITEFCDKQQLDMQDRLKLFGDVCAAVQHAHQKGIIHRDIKPSNVLVTDNDGKQLVKVIDFGVAKAIYQRLTEKTLFTGLLQVVGTPLYMSPEQADQTGQDIDTRTDVYSLGVLLYELLTGCTPFDKERLKQAAFEEVRRIIREEEPARPSLRLSTLEDTLPSVAAMRNIEPKRLSAFLRGDLDWIVMKALEKDRDRRYGTASAFAADISRYLGHEPVEASPPSVLYRLKKFTRRNRGRLAAFSLITVLLLIGLVAAIGTKLQNDLYRRQLTQDVQQSLAAAQTAIDSDDLSLALERVAKAEGRIADGHDALPQLAGNIGRLRTEIEERRQQQQRLQSFGELAREGQDRMSYGEGLGKEGDQLALQALALYGVLNDERWLNRPKESYLSNHQQSEVRQTAYETLLVLADFGVRWPKLRNKEMADGSLIYLQKAEAFYEPTRAFYWVRKECHKFLKNKQEADKDRKRFQQTAATTAFDYYLPGHTAGWRRDWDEAIRSYEAALRIQPDHYNSLFFLAWYLSKLGRKQEAAQLYRACLILRPDHTVALRNRELLVAKQGNFEEAIELLNKALELRPDSASAYNNVAWMLATCPDSEFRDPTQAVQLAQEAVKLKPKWGIYANTLGVAQYRAGNWPEAIDALQKSEELNKGDHYSFNGFFLSMAHWQLGHKDEAHQHYQQSIDWMNKNKPHDQELIQFRAEAEALLGVPVESTKPANQKSETRKQKQESSNRVGPYQPR